MVGRMWRHLEYVRSQGLRPDARMLAFVISACAADDPGSARNAFVATHCLTAMQVRGESHCSVLGAPAFAAECGDPFSVSNELHCCNVEHKVARHVK